FFAFKVMPTIIFMSSLSALLFYWGILPVLVKAMAWAMYKVMRVSGSESLVAAANIFCGQTEAPLLIRPYIRGMTRSEIHCMMTSGMATVAGGVLAAYVGMGVSAGHLLAASVMSAPAAILIAKIMVPETEHSQTLGKVEVNLTGTATNVFDAACQGAADGLKLALNVGAMLIAFIALITLFNELLRYTGSLMGLDLTVEGILGYVFYPFAFFMGVPLADCLSVASLLGEKTFLNEFIAYNHLIELTKEGALNDRSYVIS